jgi:hypothetical protein
VENIKSLPKEKQEEILKLIDNNAQRAQLNQAKPQNPFGWNPIPAPYIPPPIFAPVVNHIAPSAYGGNFAGGYSPAGIVPYGSPYANMGYNPMGGYNPYNSYGMYGGYRPY